MKLPIDPYSLEEFFVKPTDEKGHGDKVSARVPPDLSRLVEVIVASKKFPYKTSSDLFRDAIWRLAALLSPHIDSFEGTTIIARLNIMEEILKPYRAGEKLVAEIDSLGLSLLALDSLSEKKRLVGITKENLEQVSSPYWRERALKLLREKYGEYIT